MKSFSPISPKTDYAVYTYADVELPPPQSVKHIVFRTVEEEDASVIISLRREAQKSGFLSNISNDISAQEKWIRDYKDRESKRTEFYFIIESCDGVPWGALRLYDFIADDFSWGSWVLARDAPSFASIESALAVYEFAFHYCRFKKCHFEVVKGNERVAAFHKRFGADRVGENNTKEFFEFPLKAYLKTKQRYAKFLLS